MKPVSFKNFLPGIAWFFIILILICLPSDEIPEPSGWFQWIKLIQFDKLVHTGLFAVLTFLFIQPFTRAGYSKKQQWNLFLWIALAGCIWGLTTELIQKFFVPSRQFDLIDWTADSLGVLLALFFSRYYFLKRKRRNA